MSDGYRAVLPRPSETYREGEQQNNRNNIQWALNLKLDKNAFEVYVESQRLRIEALEARIAALEGP